MAVGQIPDDRALAHARAVREADPVKEPRKTSHKVAAAIAYVVLGILLFGLTLPRAYSDPYRVGYETGRLSISLLLGVAIGYGLWQLIRKGRGWPRMSPWVLFIALFATTFLRGIALPAEDFAKYPDIEPADYFVTPPGFSYRELTPEDLERARDAATADPAGEKRLLDFDARQLVRNGTVVGAVTVGELDAGPDDLESFKEGVLDGLAERAGTEPKEIDLGKRTGYLVPAPQGAFVHFFDNNVVVSVFTSKAGTATEIAEALSSGI